jgi:hypothetical protein
MMNRSAMAWGVGQHRRGASSLGCLLNILVLVILIYAGVQISEPYFHYYSFKDAVEQEARFASMRPDSLIQRRLWANADTLGLPPGAYRVKIIRQPHLVRIMTSYDDMWRIGPYTRPVHFDIDALHSQ